MSSCQPTPVQSPKKEKAPKEKAKKEKKPPKKEEKEKKKAKPKPRYETDTSTTSQYESESDSSDDEQLKKYIRKTNKRVEALKQIDDRLKYVNPYTTKGLSLFS